MPSLGLGALVGPHVAACVTRLMFEESFAFRMLATRKSGQELKRNAFRSALRSDSRNTLEMSTRPFRSSNRYLAVAVNLVLLGGMGSFFYYSYAPKRKADEDMNKAHESSE
ncbi:hypothetical protein NMY22_g5074 [Coprinellus aureogranulatus]|nr:hypothetical protein NMY22_g5074 [Coprinellus aureogranulatus]